MSHKTIPYEVKQRVNEIVEVFNENVIQERECFYSTRFRGNFLYLDRSDFGRPGPICRLTYTGDINRWGFAIYKYSDNVYDPEEWLFPGSQHVDGTIEGAMKAGLEAYAD